MLINPYKLLLRNGVSSETLFLCASESFIAVLTSVGRGLLTISLDLHAASDARVSFSSGQIGNVNESVVERGLDVAHTEDIIDVLAWLGVGRAVVGDLLLLGFVRLLLCSRLNTNGSQVSSLGLEKGTQRTDTPTNEVDRILHGEWRSLMHAQHFKI